MAIAQEVNQAIQYDRYYTAEHPTVATGVTLWAGTLAMNDAGQAKPAASGVAGSTLLGLVYQTMDNAAGAMPLSPSSAPMYLRGLSVEVEGLAGDLPTVAGIGNPVAISDNYTVKKTIAADDLTVTLLAVLPSNRFRVFVS